MSLLELAKKYPEFYSEKTFLYLETMEVFIEPAVVQKCGSIKIILGYPFTKIKFNKCDSLVGCLAALYKTTGGYADANQFEIYINKKLVTNRNTKNEELFISECVPHIVEKNTIIVKTLNISWYPYFKCTVPFLKSSPDDYEQLSREIDRWKSVERGDELDTDEEI